MACNSSLQGMRPSIITYNVIAKDIATCTSNLVNCCPNPNHRSKVCITLQEFMSLHRCEVGGRQRRLTFFFDICPGVLFCLSEWSTPSCKVTQMLIDILLPKVKVKFLSRLVDSKLSNTYLPIYRYSFFINFYRAMY